jgi:hypothetical protein
VENYLRIPKSLSARVSNLAKQITEHEHSDLGKAQAVVAWLQRTHGYTTDLKRNSSIADPLEDFLFAQKAGHCEYFASAAAVLLRASGVPTRYVNGFLGGEWNDLRKVITVRENRAHSWIEAYLSQGIGPGQVEAGWTRVDATPALSRPAHMTRMRQLLDSAELFWERWVVEYNASQQLLLAQRLGQKFGFSRRSNFPSAGQVPLTKKTGLFLAGLAVLTIVLVSQRKVLLRWRRSRRAASVKAQVGQPIVRIYQSTLARLAAMGMPRHPAETPHEYVARLRCEGVQGEETLSLLTECYTSARYGEAEIPPEQVAELRRQCKQIGAPP